MAPMPWPSMPGGDVGGLGFVCSYLTSELGSRAAAPTGQGKVGDWRFLLAISQFRRLFSYGSNKSELSLRVWIIIWSVYLLCI